MLFLLVLLTTALGAYTLLFQEATFNIGRRLSPLKDLSLQDAITPKSQTIRNLLFPAMLISLFCLTAAIYGWLVAIGTVAFCFLGLIPATKLFLPKPTDIHYVTTIITDLEKRLNEFQRKGDTERQVAANSVLEMLRSMAREPRS